MGALCTRLGIPMGFNFFRIAVWRAEFSIINSVAGVKISVAARHAGPMVRKPLGWVTWSSKALEDSRESLCKTVAKLI